jgi:hypothetical protein
MYSFEQIVGLSAGIIEFVAFLLYYLSIFQGKTRPNRATWFVLTVVGALIAGSYYASGARETLWVPISYAIGPLIAFLLSLRYGEGGFTPFDQFCLLACLVCALFWQLSHSPEVTLFAGILIDFFGLLPTIKKSYLDPLSEDKIAWSVTSLSNFLNIIAVSSWTFVIGFYPVYMFLINGLVTTLLFLPKRNKSVAPQ